MRPLPENLVVYLIGVQYDGDRNAMKLIFYEPNSNQLYRWYDDSHSPYCLTDLFPSELHKIERLIRHPSFRMFETIEKYDSLNDLTVKLTKVIANDPRAIGGGKPNENIRDIIPSSHEGAKVWEAKISYDCCYTYDKGLEMGMPYILECDRLYPSPFENKERIKEVIDKVGTDAASWIKLFEHPIPNFLRVALDIEVLGEGKNRVPDPHKADYPVISCALIGSDGKRRILILLREGVEIGNEVLPEGTIIDFFGEEANLILEIFRFISHYPFVLTFNGDSFDLMYLYYRAQKLGISKEDIPIQPRRHIVRIKNAIHIDLYRLFFNSSLKTYAFKGKYTSISLDNIGKALLGIGKLATEEDAWMANDMSTWTYNQLAKYNCQDSDITLQLTTYDDSLVMKLMVILMRISAISMEDLIRFPISVWIRGTMNYEHRKRNHLIPNRDDIMSSERKGKSATTALIKGKKYKGAIVVEPIAGTHWNAKVMDFASLYPSILKNRNIGYSTINCPHLECSIIEANKIPETPHWTCEKNIAIESEVVGLLRDLRVNWYKMMKNTNPLYSVVEQAIKVYLNASYGVFGDESFDFYCPPVAESVTAVGRHSIKETINKAQELGIEILYGDTDSVFLKNPTDSQVNSLVEWSSQVLGLDLGVDKEYRFVCLSSRKKNYLGVTLDGNLDVKGMTGKKKHIPLIIKGAFDVTKKFLINVKEEYEIEG